VHAAVDVHIIAPTVVEEERYFVTTVLQARGPRDLAPFEALAALGPPHAGLLRQEAGVPRWQTFRTAPRVCAHTHHARKYVDARLAEDRAFRFFAEGRLAGVAHNVSEFAAVIRTLPPGSLRQHLTAGDFSRWAHDVLGDGELARGLAKLERVVQHGAAPSRAELLAHLRDHYDLPADTP
jgi:hypothetical protein